MCLLPTAVEADEELLGTADAMGTSSGHIKHDGYAKCEQGEGSDDSCGHMENKV